MASGLSNCHRSPELLAVSTNISDLCKGITHVSTVPTFALSLEQKGFITSSASNSILSRNGISGEEKCSLLLKAVQQQMKMDPMKFESFVSIFSSEAALKFFADLLSTSRGECQLLAEFSLVYVCMVQ